MARPAGPVAKTAWTPVWHTWVLRARVFFRVCGQAGAAFRIQGELCLVSRNLAVPSVNYPLQYLSGHDTLSLAMTGQPVCSTLSAAADSRRFLR